MYVRIYSCMLQATLALKVVPVPHLARRCNVFSRPTTHVESSFTHCDDDLLEKSLCDASEEDTIMKFVDESCRCHHGPDKGPCSKQLSRELVTQCRVENLLSRDELDLAVLSQIRSVFKPHSHLTFAVHGISICRSTFMFLHCIGRTRLDNLMHQYQENGLVTRSHGNLKHLPAKRVHKKLLQK